MKAANFEASDAKDPVGMRACFSDGVVDIDYGVIGTFNKADDLVNVFREMGCHPHMLEIHHGANLQIEMRGDTTAAGKWGLHYQLINTLDKSLTHLGARYEDEYVLERGEWKMCKTQCIVTSTLVLSLSDDQVKCLVAGRVPMPE